MRFFLTPSCPASNTVPVGIVKIEHEWSKMGFVLLLKRKADEKNEWTK